MSICKVIALKKTHKGIKVFCAVLQITTSINLLPSPVIHLHDEIWLFYVCTFAAFNLTVLIHKLWKKQQ